MDEDPLSEGDQDLEVWDEEPTFEGSDQGSWKFRWKIHFQRVIRISGLDDDPLSESDQGTVTDEKPFF